MRPRRTPLRTLMTGAVVTALVVISTSHGRGQQPEPRASRVITPSSVPAVDAGLRPGADVQRLAATPPAGGQYNTHPRFVPDQVIVKFTSATQGLASRAQVALAVGAVDVDYPDFGDFAVFSLPAGTDPMAVSDILNARPDVEYAQPDYVRQPQFVPNDPFFNLQWNLMQVGMERAWDGNMGGTDAVTVAVIDSGLAFEDVVIEFQAGAFSLDGRDYPALGTVTAPFSAAFDLVSPNRITQPFDFVWMDDHPVDLDGHGTHVAGTLGQLTNNGEGVAGVAFNVRLMPLKVLVGEWDFIFGASPMCCGSADSAVAAAIRYAAERGADVINMSLGGPDPSPAIDDAIRFAVGLDVFVAIAGGNSFEDDNPTIWPAAAAEEIDGAVSVAAVDRHSQRAYYSSTGSFIEIAAPGGDQRTDGFDGVVQQTVHPEFAWTFFLPPSLFGPPRFDVMAYVFFSGTSSATPHVAGLAALLKSRGITDPRVIEAAIKVTATDLGEPGRDDEYGAGLINAATALRGLGLAR